jgi:hypothetical protein
VVGEDLGRMCARQARLVAQAARSCGMRRVYLESDLLSPSLTMWDAMFAKFRMGSEEECMQAYGVPVLNHSSAAALQATLLTRLLNTLRGGSTGDGGTGDGGGGGGGRPTLEVVTMSSLLAAASAARPLISLVPFLPADASKPSLTAASTQSSPRRLLNLERSLFAVAVLARADSLVRTPLASTFSGWANAIRVAERGVQHAAYTTDAGYDWWRCSHTNHLKLGKCNRKSLRSQMRRAPELCARP